MNQKMVERFYELWKVHPYRSYTVHSGSVYKRALRYEKKIGVKCLPRYKVVELCDRIPFEKWTRLSDGGSSTQWYQEGDRVFIRSQGRYYGSPPKGERHYCLVVYEFPLDFINKVVALGCMPPFSEKP